MNSHLTEAEELTRRYDLAERSSHHRPRVRPVPRRHQLATSLRRVADKLDQ